MIVLYCVDDLLVCSLKENKIGKSETVLKKHFVIND